MKNEADIAERRPARYWGLYEWMRSTVSVLLPFIFLLTFIGQTIPVEGHSMNPTFLDGDRLIVRSVLYEPERGDVILFARQDFLDGAILIKRVIALAGDVVDINTVTGTVYVNGVVLDEPYTSGPTEQSGNISYPYTVPPGHVFVLGDNRDRNGSQDSRHREIGPVDEREIIGRAIAVIFPFDRMRLFRG